MNIYLLERTDEIGWDEYSAHVIAANTVEEVRALAMEESEGCEPKKVWETATILKIGNYEGYNERPFIILSDYLNG